MCRIFFAAPVVLPRVLLDVTGVLKNRFSREKIRWVREENMHFTLWFFGETPEPEVDRYCRSMADAFRGEAAIALDYKGLGTFGRPYDPAVLWVGLKDPGGITAWYNRVVRVLQEQGTDPGKRTFTPHLTLARMKGIVERNEFLSAVASYRDREFGRVLVDKLVMFKSSLTKKGPIYEPLVIIDLAV